MQICKHIVYFYVFLGITFIIIIFLSLMNDAKTDVVNNNVS